MKYNKICECCGNKVTAYTHVMNVWLVQSFDQLCTKWNKTRRPVNINKDLTLSKVQYCNFQKLQYRWLVEHSSSWWEPTQRWLMFWQWLKPTQSVVATLGKTILRPDHEARDTHKNEPKAKYIWEFKWYEYKKREEYAKERNTTMSLFSTI